MQFLQNISLHKLDLEIQAELNVNRQSQKLNNFFDMIKNSNPEIRQNLEQLRTAIIYVNNNKPFNDNLQSLFISNKKLDKIAYRTIAERFKERFGTTIKASRIINIYASNQNVVQTAQQSEEIKEEEIPESKEVNIAKVQPKKPKFRATKNPVNNTEAKEGGIIKNSEKIVGQFKLKNSEEIINNLKITTFYCAITSKLYTMKNINDALVDLHAELLKMQRINNLPFKIELNVKIEFVIRDESNQFRYEQHLLSDIFTPLNNIDDDLQTKLKESADKIEHKISIYGNSKYALNQILEIFIRVIQYNPQQHGSYIKFPAKLQGKEEIYNIQNSDNRCVIYCFLLQEYFNQFKKIPKYYMKSENYQFTYNFQTGFLENIILFKKQLPWRFNIGRIEFPCNIQEVKRIAEGFNYTLTVVDYCDSYDISSKADDSVIPAENVAYIDDECSEQIEEQKENVNQKKINTKSDRSFTLDPHYNERQIPGKKHIDLLRLSKENDDSDDLDELNQHFVLILNFQALCRTDQVNRDQVWACRNCINFIRKQKLNDDAFKAKIADHEKHCYLKEQASRDVYPTKENNIIKFKNFKYKQTIPFFITADFESILLPTNNVQNEYGRTQTQSHICVSYGMQINDEYNLFEGEKYHKFIANSMEDNAVQHFLELLHQLQKPLRKLIQKTNINYNWENYSEEKRREIEENKTCHICEKEMEIGEERVLDHNHYTGEIRGYTHNSCNLNFNLNSVKIPVIFHNLRGYDGQFILKQLCLLSQEKGSIFPELNSIKPIIQNTEKFLSIDWCGYRFIDSFQFLSSPLAVLSENVPLEKKNKTLEYLQSRFGNVLSQEEMKLAQKGDFPYSWFDSLEKLNFEGLPKRKYFYNDLNDEELKEEDFERDCNLFLKLGFETFRDWLEFYQDLDVKLLSDIWMNFRDNSMKAYKIDPGFTRSAPGFSMEAFLLYTNAEIELITQPEMFMQIEQQSRGGISTTGNKRYAQANNKYIPGYDSSKDPYYLMYFDANNLYGHSLSQKLPYCNYVQGNPEQMTTDFILNYDLDGKAEQGYTLTVDLDYPEHLHDKHNSYPLGVEKRSIKKEELSAYNLKQLKNMEENEQSSCFSEKTKKLVMSLSPKIEYVANIKNIQFMLNQGLILKKVHKVLQYDIKAIIKDFIQNNTLMRQQAKCKSLKNLYKLLNNSIYGKTLENVRGRGNFEIVTNEKRLKKLVASRYFKHIHYITDKIALVERYQKQVNMNKPSQIGMQVLDFSKIVIQDFFYNFLQKEFSTVDLIMTDTDSLLLGLTPKDQSKDVYDIMIENEQLFDFNNTIEGNGLYEKAKLHCEKTGQILTEFLLKRKDVPGLFKNEVPDSEIVEVASVKSKSYSFITLSEKEKKTLKGTSKAALQNQIKFKQFKDCITKNEIVKTNQKGIRTFNHELFTVQMNKKLSLHPFNDKIFLLDDGINSLSYGHCKIKEIQNNQNNQNV